MVTKVLDKYLCDICFRESKDKEEIQLCEEEGIFSFPKDIVHIPFKVTGDKGKILLINGYNAIVTRTMNDHFAYHDVSVLVPTGMKKAPYLKQDHTINLYLIQNDLTTLTKKELKTLSKQLDYQGIEHFALETPRERTSPQFLTTAFAKKAAHIQATITYAQENGLKNLENKYLQEQVSQYFK